MPKGPKHGVWLADNYALSTLKSRYSGALAAFKRMKGIGKASKERLAMADKTVKDYRRAIAIKEDRLVLARLSNP